MRPKVDVMISRNINNLLRTEKRVTVPALGSFMKRSDGVIVFTDMFKDDDGVLTQHIATKMSITPAEAATDIRKFVEQVKHSLSSRGIAELSDMGILSLNDKGSITFIHKTAADSITPATDETEATQIITATIEPESKVESEEQPTAIEQEEDTEMVIEPEQPNQEQVQEVVEIVKVLQREETPAMNTPTEATTIIIPRKNKEGELFDKLMGVNEPPKKTSPTQQQSDVRPPKVAPRKRKIDWVMIIAITSAIIALLCMAFGLLEGTATTVII